MSAATDTVRKLAALAEAMGNTQLADAGHLLVSQMDGGAAREAAATAAHRDDLLRAAAYLAATNDSPDDESCISASEGTRIAGVLRSLAVAPVTPAELAQRCALAGPLLELDGLLSKFHAAVWAAAEAGDVAVDDCGNDEAKAIQQLVRSMLDATLARPHAVLLQARDTLEAAHNGLRWYWNLYPTTLSNADGEMADQIEAVTAAINAELPTTRQQEPGQ